MTPLVIPPPTPARPKVDDPSDRDWAVFLARTLEVLMLGGAHDEECDGSPCSIHMAASAARHTFARDALLGWQEWSQ